MSTFASTAMPMVNTTPAMPGSVIVEFNSDISASTSTTCSAAPTTANTPNSP